MTHQCVLRPAAALLLALGLLFAAGAAQAVTFTIEAGDSGWYDDTGAHTQSNRNYFVGYDGFGELRNFFTFSLNTLSTSQTILSASIQLYMPADNEPNASFDGGYHSGDASETYQLHEVTAVDTAVTAGGVGLTPIYDDLGDGAVFGSTSVELLDNGTLVTIALNATAIADLVNHQTVGVGDWVVGGVMTTYSGQTTAEEGFFAHTDPPGLGPYTRQLVVVLTPEPGTGLMVAAGMLALGAARTRRARMGR